MSEPLCVALGSVRRGDIERVGGKAANLGELLHAGFTVPAGFVITTAAHRNATPADMVSPGAQVIPEDTAQGIRRAYRELGEGLVAVRSSATAEDLPGATFAGQQDTFLDVTGTDDVLAAVGKCWSSLFSERAVAYRGRLGIDPSSIAMGVVVQRMVPAEAAGVMFTADPVTGARDRVIIDASRGLGEAVVSGVLIPDHVVVDAHGRIIERHPGDAALSAARAMAVTDDQVLELAALGRRIAVHFGVPQDIEWATHEGRLFVLQSRAMTALPPPPIRLNRFQRFIGPTLIELLPRRPYPMELTAWIRPSVAAHVMEMMCALTGVRISFEAMMPAPDGIVQEFTPPSPQPTSVTPARIVRTALRGLGDTVGDWRDDPLYRAYRRGVAELDRVVPRRMTRRQLAEVPLRAAALVSLMTQLRVRHLPTGLVGIIGLRLALVGRAGQMAQLIGNAPTLTKTANAELEDLAVAATQIPGLREWLVDGDLLEVGTAALLPSAANWWARLQCFLKHYGHRETASVMLVRDPSWGESPATVLGLVRVLMDVTRAERPSIDMSPGTRTRSRLVQRLARGAAEGVAFREDTHFELTRTGPAVRGAIAEVGRRLAEEGLLDDTDDVWMLTLDEVTTWAAGSPLGTSALRESAARRAASWAELAATPLIATTTLYPRRAGSGAAIVVGAAGGGGRATGRVRLIHGPDEFSTLRAGEVLVCPTTNPSWTPLFQRASAVVVDHGGMASHAAIVAREYGIPAVMGAGTATSCLHDGQMVTVDGDLGEVTAAP